jgi:6-pyruvoyltetrahydropterin/6-carboxytetrahydropterin synthase
MHSIYVKDGKMSFSAAHFVMGTEYCESLHGHNYDVEIEIFGNLDDLGMVIDFREVKKKVRSLCRTLDHRVLLPGNSDTIEVKEKNESIEVLVQGKRYCFPIEDCVILPFSATTAEYLAEYLAKKLVLPENLKVKVCVSESVGSKACFEIS